MATCVTAMWSALSRGSIGGLGWSARSYRALSRDTRTANKALPVRKYLVTSGPERAKRPDKMAKKGKKEEKEDPPEEEEGEEEDEGEGEMQEDDEAYEQGASDDEEKPKKKRGREKEEEEEEEEEDYGEEEPLPTKKMKAKKLTMTLLRVGGESLGIAMADNQVTAVHKGQLGAKEGLLVGDMITEVNGKDTHIESFGSLLPKDKTKPIKIKVTRMVVVDEAAEEAARKERAAKKAKREAEEAAAAEAEDAEEEPAEEEKEEEKEEEEEGED